MLAELVSEHLQRAGLHLPIDWRRTRDPADLVRAADQQRTVHAALTVVACDTLGDGWRDALAQLRRDPRMIGIVAVAVRGDFGTLRRWRETVDGRYPAGALLTLSAGLDQLVPAVRQSLATPEHTDFWPDGPRHPQRFWATDEGRVAHDIRYDARGRHAVLVHAAFGKESKEIAAVLSVSADQVRRHLRWLRERLGAGSDVELGRRAVELGLLDELLVP